MKNNNLQALTVRLEAFEGPLDLLYHLIEKNEIDIYDIPISILTDQYLDYINMAENKNMDSMSEFLLMAATLIEIKSKMLLPKAVIDAKDNIDPREELVRKLIEYKKYKQVAEEFVSRRQEAELVFYKQPDKSISELYFKEDETIEELLDGLTMQDIYHAFKDVMAKRENKIDRVRSGFSSVRRDMFTIDEKISYIKDLLAVSRKVKFFDIFNDSSSKMEIVVTFLAILELIKQKSILIKQKEAFGEITILQNGSD